MRKIDCHCHGFPEAVHRALKASGKAFSAIPSAPWDLAARRAEMDELDIAVELLSCPHVYAVTSDLPATCRELNDAFANDVASAPERFGAFVHLPLADTDAALAELDRAWATGRFSGVIVPSNLHSRYLDEPVFEPLWREFARRHVPVFMHPIDSPCYLDGEPPTLLSWPFDTTLAMVRLITRGLFDRHSDLPVLVSHLGGTLPFIAHRVDVGYQAAGGNPAWTCARPPSSYLSKLYLDTALGWSLPAFACARDQVGIEHIVFGTDHFNSRLPHMRKIDAFVGSALTVAEREAVYETNALRLFPTLPGGTSWDSTSN
jgi:6-methylsalicylate decarboxylase